MSFGANVDFSTDDWDDKVYTDDKRLNLDILFIIKPRT